MAQELKNKLIQTDQLQLGWDYGRSFNSEPWSFTIPRGSLTALVGPNGSGKTLLLRGILGDVPFFSGKASLHSEKETITLGRKARIEGILAYLPQEQPFDSFQQVDEFLKLAFLPEMGLWGKFNRDCEARILRNIQLLSIERHLGKTLGSLSTGERQRVFLARVLSQKSVLSLLDEPTNHLDPEGNTQIWRALCQLKGTQTLVVATHDLPQVEKNCDWVIGLSQGRLIFSGPVSDFLRRTMFRQMFPTL